jgi:hypothetical protein
VLYRPKQNLGGRRPQTPAAKSIYWLIFKKRRHLGSGVITNFWSMAKTDYESCVRYLQTAPVSLSPSTPKLQSSKLGWSDSSAIVTSRCSSSSDHEFACAQTTPLIKFCIPKMHQILQYTKSMHCTFVHTACTVP